MTTATPAPQATTPRAKAEPVKITAAKGGDTTVAPKKGAIAKAIKASGKPIMAISREFGLNPSQLRRLSLDQVAKVDTVRAEVIATALGKNLADLFDAPVDKAGAAPKATAPKVTRKGRATKAVGKIAAGQAKATQAKAAQDAEV